MITEISEWSRLENNIDRNFSQRFDERVPGSYLFNPETGKASLAAYAWILRLPFPELTLMKFL